MTPAIIILLLSLISIKFGYFVYLVLFTFAIFSIGYIYIFIKLWQISEIGFSNPTKIQLFSCLLLVISSFIIIYLGFRLIPAIYIILICLFTFLDTAPLLLEISNSYKQLDDKRSKTFYKYCEFLINKCNTFKEKRKIINLAIKCWNISLENEEKMHILTEKLLTKIKRKQSDSSALLAQVLIKKKKRYYKNHTFYIRNYKFKEINNDDLAFRIYCKENTKT